MAKYLTTEDVRLFLLDRTPADNDLELDVAFSDDDIRDAMQRAARAYNSTPPFVDRVTENNLPGDTNMFLHATAEQLMISLLSKLRRNDIDYSAGGVGVNLVAKRIAHLQQEIQEHRQRWKEEATSVKVAKNLQYAYGQF